MPSALPHALTLSALLLALLIAAHVAQTAWHTGSVPMAFTYVGLLIGAAAFGRLLDDVRAVRVSVETYVARETR